MPTQKSDVLGAVYGITYSTAGQIWKIAKGVNVVGGTAGIGSAFTGSKLENGGNVVGTNYGVAFMPPPTAGNFRIENKGSGLISGQYAVYVDGFRGSLNVDNNGDMIGSQFGLYASGSTNVKVVNHGDITGFTSGVFVASSVAGSKGTVVDNHGKIHASAFGIYISGPAGIDAKITNHKGAVIKGDQSYAIFTASKTDLTNEGKIKGLVATSGYKDKVINKGDIKGDVLLGPGNDKFENVGKAKVSGMIDSGYGNDDVDLGKKPEKLLFDSPLDSNANVDRVHDFAPGKDKIFLDEDYFSALMPGKLPGSQFRKGTGPSDPDDRIIYDKSSGKLYYDPDGTGASPQIQFAKFDKGTNLKASDFTIGEFSL